MRSHFCWTIPYLPMYKDGVPISILEGSIMSAVTAPPIASERRRRRHELTGGFRSLSKLVPLLTIVVGLLSFVAGLWVNTQNANQNRQEQWRQALEKVSFDEPNILTTGFLMESFAADPEYSDQARSIQAEALTRTNVPATFDLIFQSMLEATTNRDDQLHLVRVAEALSIELSQLHRSTKSTSDFQTFLMHPDQAFDPRSPSYARTLTLLWELDTVSHGLYCSWAKACPEYPTNLSPDRLDLTQVLWLNNELPQPILARLQKAPQFFKTCSVQNVNGDSNRPQLICVPLN